MTIPTSQCAALAVGLGLIAAPGAYATVSSAIQLTGKGDQVYSCQVSASGFAWSLKGPDAKLIDDKGSVVGRHFAGPTWQASDGSTIVGEPVISSPSPEEGAIAWLVLRVKSMSGEGRFSRIAYITRTTTHGGAAPVAGCDAAHFGQKARVPYHATYTFFPTVPPK